MSYFNQGETPLNSAEEIAEAVAGFRRLRNTAGGGVGSIFPPRTEAGLSIANVSRLVASAVGSNVTLSWLNPDAPGIGGYNVHKRVLGAAPQLVTVASGSPVRFAVAEPTSTLVFVVQPVLQNGQTASLETCPSASCH